MQTELFLRGRFAPSPSGRMHLGNLFAALLAFLDVRAQGGELLLRMEDLDPARCRLDYARQLLEDLRWLGLSWDAGYQAGERAYLQSCRTAYYAEALRSLEAQGLLYPCYCTRRERLAAAAPHRSDAVTPYTGRCRSLTPSQCNAMEGEGRRAALRVRVPQEQLCFTDANFGAQSWALAATGDLILRRSDGVFAYQLAVVVDDALMGVNRVVRGSDLLSSTAQQLWLFRSLGYAQPSYAHTPLLTDGQGRRLSKRDRDLDMAALRAESTPERVLGLLAHLAGLIERVEPIALEDLIPRFDWEKVGQQDRVVTAEHLAFLRA